MSIFRIILIWRHANSCKVAQSRVKSVYFRTSWAVMGKSRKSLLFPNFSPKLPAKSCQVIGIHGQSCQVRGILRTMGGGGYIHTHNSVCCKLNEIRKIGVSLKNIFIKNAFFIKNEDKTEKNGGITEE